VSTQQPVASSLLADLPESALSELRAAGQVLVLEPGEVLMREGDEPDGLYLVLEGELAVSREVNGTESLLGVSRAGEPLGELSVVRGRPRLATVRASTVARVLRVSPEDLDGLLRESSVVRSLLTTMSRRLEVLELQLRQQERMAMLGSLSAGLLHELNNPAAAVARGLARVGEVLDDWQKVDADTEPGLREQLHDLLAQRCPPASALGRLDVEEALGARLRELGCDAAADLVPPLAAVGLLPDDLDGLVAEHGVASLRWVALRGRLQRLLDEASAGAVRISEVVAAMKRYAHVDEAPAQEVDLHEGLEAALTLLAGKLAAGVRLVRDYDPEMPTVAGYPADLNVVWTNLLDNALDAIGEQGMLLLRTVWTGTAARVEIENTGRTIPPEILDRVFDPFFTTKPIGKGTGLGLATSYAVIVHRHGGRLELSSEEGRTVAMVTLPASAGRPPESDPPDP
jgi:signal transduction histidine kinase